MPLKKRAVKRRGVRVIRVRLVRIRRSELRNQFARRDFAASRPLVFAPHKVADVGVSVPLVQLAGGCDEIPVAIVALQPLLTPPPPQFSW